MRDISMLVRILVIPYFEQPALELGPFTIHAFGVLVATGVLVGFEIFKRRSARIGLDTTVAGALTWWVVIGGFVGAHLFDRLFYNFGATLEAPWTLFMPWLGISSYGGFFGAIAGGWLYLRRYPQGLHTWRYLDGIAFAFPFGWLFGRLGCFLAFDHVGAPTEFLLGQEYLDGVVRYNLGLLEALYALPLIGLMLVLDRVRDRKARPSGFLAGALVVAYAPGRFLLDFLRVSDERHFGLLVSQYASMALFALGLWILWSCWRRRAFPTDTGEDSRIPPPGVVLTA